MNWQAYIHTDPEILMGKPVLKGTRLSVEFLLGRLADGWTEEDLLTNYPSLNRDRLRAVFAYAYDCLKDGLLFPFSKSA